MTRPPWFADELPLTQRYEAIVCDLDGVVYRGAEPVPHAVPVLERARTDGMAIAYATNNASRPPSEVAAQLRDLGLVLEDSHVVTSAQAGAAAIRERIGQGSRVLAVGGSGVGEALQGAGMVPVRANDVRPDGVAAVLQGYGATVAWVDLAEIAYAVAGGAWWVATNDDATLPTARGIAPGNGALVAAVRMAVAVDPHVVGKPHPPLYELCAERVGSVVAATLAVGDRLDTDIAGAVATGMDSLLVLTGVHGIRAACTAPAEQRPHYVAFDLRALHAGYAQPVRVTSRGPIGSTVTGPLASTASESVATVAPAEQGTATWQCGEALVEWRPGEEPVVRSGSADERLRALVAAAWELVDHSGMGALGGLTEEQLRSYVRVP